MGVISLAIIVEMLVNNLKLRKREEERDKTEREETRGRNILGSQ